MTDLRQAAQAVLDRWDSPQWEWVKNGPTADLMHALREALAAPTQEPVAQEQAEPVCKCSLRTRLVGDGCEVCNPELAAELRLEKEQPAPEPVAGKGDGEVNTTKNIYAHAHLLKKECRCANTKATSCVYFRAAEMLNEAAHGIVGGA